MTRNNLFILLSCLFLFSGFIRVNAQYALSVEPSYLANGGLRLNVAKRLTPKEWIELNITGYRIPRYEINDSYYWGNVGNWITSNSDFNEFTELSGGGLGGTYKYYFHRLFFAAASTSYTYYDVEYNSWDFHAYTEEGLTFYDHEIQNISQPFHKLTGNLSIGFRPPFRRAFFMEFNGGLGYAYSFYNKDKRPFNESPFGFGYRGVYPMMSFKIGFHFK
jgi:hypothetical protein